MQTAKRGAVRGDKKAGAEPQIARNDRPDSSGGSPFDDGCSVEACARLDRGCLADVVATVENTRTKTRF
jgi:hypothetical protein